MSVLADEVRLVVQSVALLNQLAHHRVHVRTEVGVLLAVVAALVVNPCVATRQQTLHAVVCSLEVAAAASLVAERPEHHARVVAVAQHHACRAVYVCSLPRRHVRDALVAVTLHVSLVHAVESVVVEHGVHLRLARIVRCAHGVYVGLLHQLHVAQHRLHVDGVTKERMDVLRVHTLEVNTLAVNVDEVALLLHGAEAVLRREHHLLAAVVQLAYDDGVEPRVLRRPELHVVQTLEVYRNSLLCVLCCQRHSLLLLCNELTCGVEQLHFERLACSLLQRVVYGQLHVYRACGVALAELRCDVMVAYSHLRSSHEIHVAVDAGEVPHVLTLKIRTVRPAVHAHRYVVLALAHECRHVELGVGVRTLRESGILAVHPYHDGAARSVEVEHYALLLLPALGQVERAAVRTHRVLVEVVVHRLDARWVVVERIAHIVIYRHIIASHLPVERHLDVVPS